MDKFSIVIAGLPHRERPVAEICFEGEQWAEISYDDEDPVIQFFSPDNTDFWEFQLDEALEALIKAKNKLLEI